MSAADPISVTRFSSALAGLIALDPAHLDNELHRVVAADWPASSPEGNVIAELIEMRSKAVDLFQVIDTLYD